MASCLDSPVRGIRLWHPKQIFFEEKDDAAPQSPHWHVLKIYLWKELLSTEK